MIKKIYLLWHAYSTKELLTIASLEKIDNNKYLFKYEKDAIKAKSMGCFLPFNYTDEELYFSSLPTFFSQRMLTSKFYIDKLNIKYDSDDILSILCYGNGVKNTDNYSIVSDIDYMNLYCTGFEQDFLTEDKGFLLKK